MDNGTYVDGTILYAQLAPDGTVSHEWSTDGNDGSVAVRGDDSTIYLATQDQHAGGAVIRLWSSADDGATFTEHAQSPIGDGYYPRVNAPGSSDDVVVSWEQTTLPSKADEAKSPGFWWWDEAAAAEVDGWNGPWISDRAFTLARSCATADGADLIWASRDDNDTKRRNDDTSHLMLWTP